MTRLDFDLEVSQAHLEAAGWDIGSFQHSNPFLCHVVYVRDYRTDHIELFSINMQDFEKTKPPLSAGELSGLVARLVKRHQRGRLTTKESRSLLPVLVSYVKGTQSYKIWRNQTRPGERLHAALNIYPGRVRPFIMREEGTVVTAEALIAATDQARAMDRQKHPDWFSD